MFKITKLQDVVDVLKYLGVIDMTRKPTSSFESSSSAAVLQESADGVFGLSREQIIDQMQQFTVVKRNGSIVPFRRERIFRALDAAFRDTRKIDRQEPLPSETNHLIESMTDLILLDLYTLAAKGASLTVEGIQDMVEIVLMKEGNHDVARDYIIYRDKHKILREDSPQNLKVVREDGSAVRFNPMKIASALEEAFRRSQQTFGPSTEKMIESVNFLTQKVVAKAIALSKMSIALTDSLIEDEIEQQLKPGRFFRCR